MITAAVFVGLHNNWSALPASSPVHPDIALLPGKNKNCEAVLHSIFPFSPAPVPAVPSADGAVRSAALPSEAG